MEVPKVDFAFTNQKIFNYLQKIIISLAHMLMAKT